MARARERSEGDGEDELCERETERESGRERDSMRVGGRRRGRETGHMPTNRVVRGVGDAGPRFGRRHCAVVHRPWCIERAVCPCPCANSRGDADVDILLSQRHPYTQANMTE